MPVDLVEIALARIEGEGQALRGNFSAGAEQEWCNRRVLARIHRLTLGRLRREIEPVSTADFLRFLARWQHVARGSQLHGVDGLRVVDAPVFPYVTNGNIYAPVMMVAEKAADLILGNTPLEPSKAEFFRRQPVATGPVS